MRFPLASVALFVNVRMVVSTAIPTPMAMATMHEDMHERTEQQDQVRQCCNHMSAMLEQQKIDDRSDKGDPSQAVRRTPEAAFSLTCHIEVWSLNAVLRACAAFALLSLDLDRVAPDYTQMLLCLLAVRADNPLRRLGVLSGECGPLRIIRSTSIRSLAHGSFTRIMQFHRRARKIPSSRHRFPRWASTIGRKGIDAAELELSDSAPSENWRNPVLRYRLSMRRISRYPVACSASG